MEKQLIMISNIETVSTEPMNGKIFYLRTIASNITRKAALEYDFDNKKFTQPGNKLAMRFSLIIFTGNVSVSLAMRPEKRVDMLILTDLELK
ncbi:MAG: hypothetical protein Q8908_04275 [Bacteroidota bacterium]|nr:hypothetical protein [Bacteroidota bacterium]